MYLTSWKINRFKESFTLDVYCIEATNSLDESLVTCGTELKTSKYVLQVEIYLKISYFLEVLKSLNHHTNRDYINFYSSVTKQVKNKSCVNSTRLCCTGLSLLVQLCV